MANKHTRKPTRYDLSYRKSSHQGGDRYEILLNGKKRHGGVAEALSLFYLKMLVVY